MDKNNIIDSFYFEDDKGFEYFIELVKIMNQGHSEYERPKSYYATISWPKKENRLKTKPQSPSPTPAGGGLFDTFLSLFGLQRISLAKQQVAASKTLALVSRPDPEPEVEKESVTLFTDDGISFFWWPSLSILEYNGVEKKSGKDFSVYDMAEMVQVQYKFQIRNKR